MICLKCGKEMQGRRYAKYLSVKTYRTCDCGERLCPDQRGDLLVRLNEEQRQAVGVTPKP